MSGAYYNENDPFAAQWLRNLIGEGLIAGGEVDERSIVDVRADDLRGFTQCHFFAGLGGWPLALRLARWPDRRPIWSGSCPCQPYSIGSVAHGGAKGQCDERHLWPDFFRLIRIGKPDTIVGEQVATAVGWGWWDEAALDMESEAYACAAMVLRADAYRAFHERKRLYWMAHAGRTRWQGHKHIECFSLAEEKTRAEFGNPLAELRRVLEGDYRGLLLRDGLSVQVERHATHAYGGTIVPEVAASFIIAASEAIDV